MNSADLRKAFLSFFEQSGHQVVSSSSLVPANDPTLLFTNAGMNQFKDLFLGKEKRSYQRAASSQKCVRAGGKHNDLENVGYTARHHTFFEMLGNFSFGDYFKREAVRFAWTFLTSPDWLAIPVDRLWITVYAEDDETFGLWQEEAGVPADRIIRIGDNKGERYASDNFWQMGDTGPCGPCTEIFYDHGPDVPGGLPGTPEEDGDRYIEVWNIVFMQYNRLPDGSMERLPRPSVDTGMGLERIAAVMQQVHSNYEIDLFQRLLADASRVLGGVDPANASLRVIADHIRSCSFLIADGVAPSNEGRGFVLRRIIRRAVRHGNKLGAGEPFFYRLVGGLVAEMGDAFPELRASQMQIEQVLQQEEEQFARTLDKGLRLLEADIADLQAGSEIPGETVFTLYDTYGFPVDLTNDIARERGLSLDMSGFEAAMEVQRSRARAHSRFGVDYSSSTAVNRHQSTFTGYETDRGRHTVVQILRDGQEAETLEAGEEGAVILEATPFYAESGGQVGDQGLLLNEALQFRVEDTRKSGDAILHVGRLERGQLKSGLAVDTLIDVQVRRATAFNHSATHLLHAALRRIVGEHVTQKGSLVDAERLRFDFSHYEALTPEQLRQIETLVNEQVQANTPVSTELASMDEAREKGALALFGEKYGDQVRVLTMGEERFSVELCGGTHVRRTGDIGLFLIVGESGVAAGVRRIEAVTGLNALSRVRAMAEQLDTLAQTLKSGRDDLGSRLETLLARDRQLERENRALKSRLIASAGDELLQSAREIAGVRVLAVRVDSMERKSLLDMMERLRSKLGRAVVLLASVEGEQIAWVAGVSKAESSRLKAGDLIREVAAMTGGKGGGRPDMAQGGGNQPERLEEALGFAAEWVARGMGEAG